MSKIEWSEIVSGVGVAAFWIVIIGGGIWLANSSGSAPVTPETNVSTYSEFNIDSPEPELIDENEFVESEPLASPRTQSGNCNPNYSGCVPIASDVDCAGGSGNGPEYVDGPIEVIGDDPYGLDRDGDGIACE